MLVGLRHLPCVWVRVLILLSLAVVLGVAAGLALYPTTAHSQELDKPLFVFGLERADAKYHGTVALVAPIPGGGGHIGLILNRPMSVHLGDLFPDHEASAKVVEPIFRGGFELNNVIFALARSGPKPSAKSFEMMPGIWLITDRVGVDLIIEQAPSSARFFIGIVRWGPGLLEENIKEGLVAVRPADAAKVFMEDPSKLWDDAPVMPRGRRFDA